MSVRIAFDNSYARLPEQFHTRIDPAPVRAPALLKLNAALAAELGVAADSDEDASLAFSGNAVPDGAEPLAQVYAGHQFGGFSPQLGDGRANLLGETLKGGRRRDIQLKGSGPTPYSRMGDGRAWLGPVLREYAVSEAMHALGVPTTRALAAVATGETVRREAGALPGAVLTRVAASHIRVGTFEYFAARGDAESLRILFAHAADRHCPGAETPEEMLETVAARQAELVATWMSLGFIHGVMNTDNTAISGETIDYGPCAFMDAYHPDRVFSSIDTGGRYAYASQPGALMWNLARFAESLLPLAADPAQAAQRLSAIVGAVPEAIRAHWRRLFGRKIGIAEATEEDAALAAGLLERMAAGRADFTRTFRGLADGSARAEFDDPAAFDGWAEGWRGRIASESDSQELMRRSNPALIPRNHQIERMILAAAAGDMAPFERLSDALAAPFEESARSADLALAPRPHEIVARTFCGT